MSETMTRGRLTKFLRDSLEGYSGVTVANFDSRQPTLFLFPFIIFFSYFISSQTQLLTLDRSRTRSLSLMSGMMMLMMLTAFMMPLCCVD